MKIKLLAVGKTEEQYLNTGIEKYVDRLHHYVSFEWMILPDIKGGGKMSLEKLKEAEGKLILSKMNTSDHVILLDEIGNSYTSAEFSKFLQKKMNASVSTLVFVIGGAFGFSEEVYKRANERMAFSKMTFSHQMIRLFFVEQLYRGFTILKGEKYHHS